MRQVWPLFFLSFSSHQDAVQTSFATLCPHSAHITLTRAHPVWAPRLPTQLPRARARAIFSPTVGTGHTQDSVAVSRRQAKAQRGPRGGLLQRRMGHRLRWWLQHPRRSGGLSGTGLCGSRFVVVVLQIRQRNRYVIRLHIGWCFQATGKTWWAGAAVFFFRTHLVWQPALQREREDAGTLSLQRHRRVRL